MNYITNRQTKFSSDFLDAVSVLGEIQIQYFLKSEIVASDITKIARLTVNFWKNCKIRPQ